eukprot:TRINITY_DN2369_c0_g3_i1.p1 TRINITY_DN2369_c0_g3~~TRINITY_DN2369_c0_g3_i1.p1  ORF type:complete len:1617 (+),score=501.06 TRINITY_DN2369_c0_g3_i1:650-4852(+)
MRIALENILVYFIQDHVSADEITGNDIFRGDSIMSALIEIFMQSECRDYLRSMLGPFIEHITSPQLPCEIFPNLVKTTDQLSKNILNLKTHLHYIIGSILESIDLLPRDVLKVFSVMYKQVQKKYPENSVVKYYVISSFLFLRILNAAFVAPSKFDLIQGKNIPDQMMFTRTMTYIAKFLQTLASFSSFQQKESYMIPLEDVLKIYRDKIRDFMDQIGNSIDGLSDSDIVLDSSSTNDQVKGDDEVVDDVIDDVDEEGGDVNKNPFQNDNGKMDSKSSMGSMSSSSSLSSISNLQNLPLTKSSSKIHDDNNASREPPLSTLRKSSSSPASMLPPSQSTPRDTIGLFVLRKTSKSSLENLEDHIPKQALRDIPVDEEDVDDEDYEYEDDESSANSTSSGGTDNSAERSEKRKINFSSRTKNRRNSNEVPKDNIVHSNSKPSIFKKSLTEIYDRFSSTSEEKIKTDESLSSSTDGISHQKQSSRFRRSSGSLRKKNQLGESDKKASSSTSSSSLSLSTKQGSASNSNLTSSDGIPTNVVSPSKSDRNGTQSGSSSSSSTSSAKTSNPSTSPKTSVSLRRNISNKTDKDSSLSTSSSTISSSSTTDRSNKSGDTSTSDIKMSHSLSTIPAMFKQNQLPRLPLDDNQSFELLGSLSIRDNLKSSSPTTNSRSKSVKSEQDIPSISGKKSSRSSSTPRETSSIKRYHSDVVNPSSTSSMSEIPSTEEVLSKQEKKKRSSSKRIKDKKLLTENENNNSNNNTTNNNSHSNSNNTTSDTSDESDLSKSDPKSFQILSSKSRSVSSGDVTGSSSTSVTKEDNGEDVNATSSTKKSKRKSTSLSSHRSDIQATAKSPSKSGSSRSVPNTPVISSKLQFQTEVTQIANENAETPTQASSSTTTTPSSKKPGVSLLPLSPSKSKSESTSPVHSPNSTKQTNDVNNTSPVQYSKKEESDFIVDLKKKELQSTPNNVVSDGRTSLVSSSFLKLLPSSPSFIEYSRKKEKCDLYYRRCSAFVFALLLNDLECLLQELDEHKANQLKIRLDTLVKTLDLKNRLLRSNNQSIPTQVKSSTNNDSIQLSGGTGSKPILPPLQMKKVSSSKNHNDDQTGGKRSHRKSWTARLRPRSTSNNSNKDKIQADNDIQDQLLQLQQTQSSSSSGYSPLTGKKIKYDKLPPPPPSPPNSVASSHQSMEQPPPIPPQVANEGTKKSSLSRSKSKPSKSKSEKGEKGTRKVESSSKYADNHSIHNNDTFSSDIDPKYRSANINYTSSSSSSTSSAIPIVSDVDPKYRSAQPSTTSTPHTKQNFFKRFQSSESSTSPPIEEKTMMSNTVEDSNQHRSRSNSGNNSGNSSNIHETSHHHHHHHLHVGRGHTRKRSMSLSDQPESLSIVKESHNNDKLKKKTAKLKSPK